MERERYRTGTACRRLREGLMQLLQHKDLDQIRVTELCAISGMNRATFYRHYSGAEDVLEEMEREIDRGIDVIRPLPGNPGEARCYMEALCGYLQGHISALRVLIRCRAETVLERHMERVCSGIVQKMAQEQNTCQESFCLEMVSTFLAGGVCFLLKRWIQEEPLRTPAQVAEVVADLIRRESDFRCCGTN